MRPELERMDLSLFQKISIPAIMSSVYVNVSLFIFLALPSLSISVPTTKSQIAKMANNNKSFAEISINQVIMVMSCYKPQQQEILQILTEYRYFTKVTYEQQHEAWQKT